MSKFLFNKQKYLMLLIALILLIIGFVLLIGGGSSGSDFNPEKFSNRRIIIAPIFIIVAFVLSGIAIMKKR